MPIGGTPTGPRPRSPPLVEDLTSVQPISPFPGGRPVVLVDALVESVHPSEKLFFAARPPELGSGSSNLSVEFFCPHHADGGLVTTVCDDREPVAWETNIPFPSPGSGVLRKREEATGWEHELEAMQFVGYLVDLDPGGPVDRGSGSDPGRLAGGAAQP